MIVDSKSQSVIEVGTSNGYSGIWLGKALKKTGGKLTTIEFYDKRLDIAKTDYKDFEVDFAFIDANKRQYIDFFHLIAPHLKVGGYVACDNVISHAEKVQTFLDDINANPDYENVVLPLPAGLSLAKKLR